MDYGRNRRSSTPNLSHGRRGKAIKAKTKKVIKKQPPPVKSPTEWLHDHLRLVIAVGAVVGIVFSAYFFIDRNYASVKMIQTEAKRIDKDMAMETKRIDGEFIEVKTDLSAVDARLEYKIISDQYHDVRKRKWDLEDRYPMLLKDIMKVPPVAKDQYRDLQTTEEMLKRRLEEFEKKGIGIK